jgi:crotonobetainyl-CoA:carnitine CoA-transferase CaiB-like acyl-CoA transferase
VPKLSATPGAMRWCGPELGAHTEAILAELGKTDQDIQELRRQGVVQ